jgi:O-antigen/teichoic acid export membrane protein
MISTIMLEPMVAQGSLSTYKAANTLGALVAIPVLAIVVWRHGSPTLGVFAYFLCLIVPNGYLLVREGIVHPRSLREIGRLRWGHVAGTFRTGGWFYVTSMAAVAKTHGLTFLVSALGGPAMAGTFYILLRITEIIGTLGVTSSDTTLAALASEPEPRQRGENFRHAYAYALIFCLHGALATGFLTPLALRYWLPADQLAGLSPGVGWLMAAYGLATAFSKLVVCSAIPVGIFRRTTVGNVAEALLTLVAGWLLLPHFGLAGLFAGAAPTVLALIPAALALSHNFTETARQTWVAPLRPLLWPLAGSTAALAVASATGLLLPAIAAALVVGASALLALRRLHGEQEVVA